MKARFGGLLAIALGTVLIVNGVSSASSGTVGVGNPSPVGICGNLRALGAGIAPVEDCPTGSVVVTETTTGSVTPPAAGWQVTVTSLCIDPSTSAPVNRTLTVADGATVTFGNLFIFPTLNATPTTPKCQYTLAETAVAGVTATFDPASPVEIGFGDSSDDRTVAVALTNTADAPESSTPPSDTTAPSESAAPTESGPTTDFTDTAAGSASAGAGDESSSAAAAGGQTAAPVAATGPSQPITASLWVGIGLLFLGLFLLFEGRIRKLGKHRS